MTASRRHARFSLIRLGLLASLVTAAGAAADKREYSFANPTPDALLREMSTDRPDATESPFTLDAGHVQIEMDAANFMHDRSGGGRTRQWGLAPFNLRFGVRQNLEVGVFFAPYIHVSEQTGEGPTTTAHGSGDTTLRAKLNFWGNDGGPTALGLLVDLKLPTAARGLGNERFESAITLPFTFELGGGWKGGAMTLIEIIHTGAGGYRPVWGNTITFGHDITKEVGGYLELTSSAGDGRYAVTCNVGFTRRVDANTQFDCGVTFGISRAAPDVGLFAGVSRRF